MSTGHALWPAAPEATDQDRPRELDVATTRLHPDLLDLIERTNVALIDDLRGLPEAAIARAATLAISLADDAEQAQIVSRIMTDEDLALQRLRNTDVQDLSRRILFNTEERRLILRRSPEPDSERGRRLDECIVCGDSNTERLPCGCTWCLACLRECIRVGLRSELAARPHCCNDFDETTVRIARRPALVHLFRQLEVEWTTEPARRTYCSDPRCGEFIPDAVPQSGVVACSVCGRGTCAMCGARGHAGLPCNADVDEEVFWEMMDGHGFVGCPQCGVVVSLRDGCNHMTCLCGAQFCYICGGPWPKTCNCPLYGGLGQRVPVRWRPGRRPIARGSRAHLATHDDDALKIPQLKSLELLEAERQLQLRLNRNLVADPGPAALPGARRPARNLFSPPPPPARAGFGEDIGDYALDDSDDVWSGGEDDDNDDDDAWSEGSEMAGIDMEDTESALADPLDDESSSRALPPTALARGLNDLNDRAEGVRGIGRGEATRQNGRARSQSPHRHAHRRHPNGFAEIDNDGPADHHHHHHYHHRHRRHRQHHHHDHHLVNQRLLRQEMAHEAEAARERWRHAADWLTNRLADRMEDAVDEVDWIMEGNYSLRRQTNMLRRASQENQFADIVMMRDWGFTVEQILELHDYR